MKLNVGHLLEALFIGGLAFISQYSSNKQTERIVQRAQEEAYIAAGMGVENKLMELGLLEDKTESQSNE